MKSFYIAIIIFVVTFVLQLIFIILNRKNFLTKSIIISK